MHFGYGTGLLYLMLGVYNILILSVGDIYCPSADILEETSLQVIHFWNLHTS